MMRKSSFVVGGLFLAAVMLSANATRADSAAQIYAGAGLDYVKHVNNLAEGVTTLWVRSTCAPGYTTARITFQAQVKDKVNVTKEIFASFRGGEQKKFVINWGTAITDLNFIKIIPIRTTCGNGGGGPGGGCEVGSDGKVTICHIPPGNPGNPQTIRVSASAVPAHLAHGDSCGPCK